MSLTYTVQAVTEDGSGGVRYTTLFVRMSLKDILAVVVSEEKFEKRFFNVVNDDDLSIDLTHYGVVEYTPGVKEGVRLHQWRGRKNLARALKDMIAL